MKDLFICHSSKDKPFVRLIGRTLKSFGVKVWLDEWELRVGDSLHTKIEDGIKDSSFMLVVLSKNSLNSQWVKRELNSGLSLELNKKNIYVIPALVDISASEMPLMLTDKVAADFRNDFDIGINAILKRLRITRRNLRMEDPTEDDVKKAHAKLDGEKRHILWWQCLERSKNENGNIIFETEYLDQQDRRDLISMSHRDLIRVKVIKKGHVWDDRKGEFYGCMYRGTFTKLGLKVAHFEEKRVKEILTK